MKVEVILINSKGRIRNVEIHDDTAESDILDSVYLNGQNDIQKQDLPSVSSGDIIKLGSDLYLIKSIGFKKLVQDELLAVKKSMIHAYITQSDLTFTTIFERTLERYGYDYFEMQWIKENQSV